MVSAKKTGILERMKSAVSGMFSKEPDQKSAKRVEAGKKAAATAKVTKAATTTKKAVKKVVRKASGPVKATAKKAK